MRFGHFGSRFTTSLQDRAGHLRSTVSRVLGTDKGRIHPLLMLLATGTYKRMASGAVGSTILLRLLRATALVRSSIVSRAGRHHKIPSLGTVFSGHVSILINSCILSATLVHSVRANGLRVVNVISGLKHSLSRKRVGRLRATRRDVVSRSYCVRIVQGGATVLLSTYTRVNSVSTKTSNRVIRGYHRFNRCLNCYFRVGSSVFSCFGRTGVNGPANGSVQRKGIALPLLRTLRANEERRTRRYLRVVGRGSFAARGVSLLVSFTGTGKKVRCTRRHVRMCRSGTIRILVALPRSRTHRNLLLLTSCVMRHHG